MQRMFSALMAAFRHILFVGLISVISLTGLWSIAPQPAYAATTASQKPSQEAVISPDGESYATREEAYEKAIQAANDPKGLEKEYEKDLKIYKEENPDKANIVEEAKDVIEKVTGKN